jgi:hypothetical protein
MEDEMSASCSTHGRDKKGRDDLEDVGVDDIKINRKEI